MPNDWINSLSEEWILYTINQEDLHTFKEVANRYEQDVSSHIPLPLQELNIYVTVCNVWFTLRSFKKLYFLDETRRMNYAAAYIQLEFVERHAGIKQFIRTRKLNEAELFYLAFFVSIECMQWVMTIMEHAQQEEIIAHYMQEENFLHTTTDETSDDFKQTLDFQRIYVKEMMKNLKETTELDHAMKIAMNQTRQLLISQPISQKNRQ